MSTLENPVAQRNGRTLNCPRCQELLRVSISDDVEVDFCDKCKGVWVDNAEENQILNIKPASFTIEELHRLRKAYKLLGRVEDVKYVACPVCRQLMYRKIWGAHSGVMVDRCAAHGVWFDPGEIEKIREYVALGGVEYEKLRLTEKGLDELDQKLYKEVNRLDLKIMHKGRLLSIFYQ